MNINPDWSEYWTPEKAEKELKKQKFVFKGEGWYEHKGDYLLVIKYNGCSVKIKDGSYRFSCYGFDPREEMRKLADMPMRSVEKI